MFNMPIKLTIHVTELQYTLVCSHITTDYRPYSSIKKYQSCGFPEHHELQSANTKKHGQKQLGGWQV